MTSQKSHLTASAGECCLILAMCLGVPIATSFSAMARYSETTTYAFTDSSFANLIIIEILSLSAAGFALHCKGWRFEDLRMRISIKQSGAGLLLLVVYYALFILLYHGITDLFGMQKGWSRQPIRAGYSLGMAVFFSAVNAFFEESVTVGYVLNSMRHHGQLFAVSLSMFVRLLYHTYQGFVAVVSIVPMGILFAVYYSRRRALWPLIVAHFVLDFVALMEMKLSILSKSFH